MRANPTSARRENELTWRIALLTGMARVFNRTGVRRWPLADVWSVRLWAAQLVIRLQSLIWPLSTSGPSAPGQSARLPAELPMGARFPIDVFKSAPLSAIPKSGWRILPLRRI